MTASGMASKRNGCEWESGNQSPAQPRGTREGRAMTIHCLDCYSPNCAKIAPR